MGSAKVKDMSERRVVKRMWECSPNLQVPYTAYTVPVCASVYKPLRFCMVNYPGYLLQFLNHRVIKSLRFKSKNLLSNLP